jgi:hypothetical protein|tara:strand:- start:45 stop:392 length:348 start_codon:yes stop_codon:yes gene_type:complete
MASGDELLKVHTHRGSANDLATAQVMITAGSGKTCTVISISLCNTHASNDETFDIYIDTGSGDDTYLYLEQSLPAKSTFVHNDKIVLEANDHLDVHCATGGGDIDVIVSYLEQEL